MRRLKGFFALFPDFKKKCGVRPPVRRYLFPGFFT